MRKIKLIKYSILSLFSFLRCFRVVKTPKLLEKTYTNDAQL